MLSTGISGAIRIFLKICNNLFFLSFFLMKFMTLFLAAFLIRRKGPLNQLKHPEELHEDGVPR